MKLENNNFQPIPKRFMVWEKEYQQFARKVLPGGKREYVYTLDEMSFYYDDPDCIICQSTNLFDKDGKEIFEGSIMRLEGYSEDGVSFRSNYFVYGSVYNKEGSWYLKVYEAGKLINDELEISEALEGGKVVGHILSNPELLEEKCA